MMEIEDDYIIRINAKRLDIFLDNLIFADFADQDRYAVLANIRWCEMKILHSAPQYSKRAAV